MRSNKLEYFKIGMLLLNSVAVMLISVFVNVTTEDIRARFYARRFLDGVNAIPPRPAADIVYCGMLLLILVCAFILRKKVFPQNKTLIYISLALDFAISILIVYILDFNYNGILLFVFANVLAHTKDSKIRYSLIMLAVVSFLVTGYEFAAISNRLYSIRDYIAFYAPAIQQYLFGIYNGIISLNIIMFILYCVYEIIGQQGTIDEVNNLYDRLSKANRYLENANEQLRDYAVITEKMGETRERNRLAREIHDTLGHTLTGISAGIDACITTLSISPEETKKQLNIIARVTREGIADVRRSVNELRVDAQENPKLEHNVTKMITDMQAVTDAKIYFTNKAGILKLSEDEENAIYRVIQESVTNAIRHGKAEKIWIELNHNDGHILLVVEDNGIGCKEVKSGFGTKHIRERIEMLGGKVAFGGTENGFKVTGEIPVRWGCSI
ncbi:MAG: sensor histidine kinase [Oscillospiraceae bacterium]|nr:sensor histidine kinase [Oscillospiraceae bacterium]